MTSCPTMPPALTMLFVLLAALVARVRAHAMMCTPRQRAAYSSIKCGYDLYVPNAVTDHCAHCLNGGTVETVKANLPPVGWRPYAPTQDFYGTADRAGLCGDPKYERHHMLGGVFMPFASAPVVATWAAGSFIDFEAAVDTNHNGYFEFFLCNLDACAAPDLDARCFEQRHCVRLNRVPHPACESPSPATSTECGPIDVAHPSRWYVPCRKTAHVGVHLMGGRAGTMRYQLPPNLRCEHCVVQWYWATANSCAPPGFKQYIVNYGFPFGTTCESDGGTRGTYRADMAECGGRLVPEEFWTCADVRIV